MLWFLLFAAIAAVLIVLLISSGGGSEDGIGTSPAETTQRTTGLGAPVFVDSPGRKRLASELFQGMKVWALTPYGPQPLTVTDADTLKATLENDAMVVSVYLDNDFFSADLNIESHHAWRVSSVQRKRGSVGFYTADAQRDNRRWIRDESYWGDDEFDLFDWLLMYHFMFDGFHEPFDYYDTYDMPAYEDLPIVVEDPVPPPVNEEPFKQVEEEVAETAPPEEPPADEEIVDAPPEVNEDTNFDFEEPAPEPTPPEPTPEPEPMPAPDPEPYEPPPVVEDDSWKNNDTGWGDSGGGSSFDDGGSSDFGGGGDDW